MAHEKYEQDFNLLPRQELEDLLRDIEIDIALAWAHYLESKRDHDQAVNEFYLITTGSKSSAELEARTTYPHLSQRVERQRLEWYQLTQHRNRLLETLTLKPRPRGRPSRRSIPSREMLEN